MKDLEILLKATKILDRQKLKLGLFQLVDLKLIALGTTGVATATAVSLGVSYLAGAFDDGSFVPTGKTLKTRYPKIKVPEYKSTYGTLVNNSFWRPRARKLSEKYFPNKAVWEPLYESIKANNVAGNYNFHDDNFKWEEARKEFSGGDSQIAEVLAKYCIYSENREEPKIENYADVLKDLCT